MKKIILVVVDVRSSHNVGSLLRTCDGLGIDAVYLCGITPYPDGLKNDDRLPHIIRKTTTDIHKTALGAEHTVSWHHHTDTLNTLTRLKANGWRLCALEQTGNSVPVIDYVLSDQTALLVGNEVTGLDASLLGICDDFVEIPMKGKKESFNVSIASAIALYEFSR